jgi:segregation and condensation protein B
MSSRKRKKRGERSEGAEASASELPEGADEGPAAAASSDAERAPAFSEIVELRPHDDAEAEELAQPSEDEEEEEVIDALAAIQAPKTLEHKKRVIESLIFVSDSVITAVQLGRIAKIKVAEVRDLLLEICVDYEGRGIELVEINGGYQFRSVAASAPYVRSLVAQRPVRLTKAQLETLALIAYRQPITRPEIDDVRGVDSGSAIRVLLERELVKILGRKEEAGRPLLYGTTPHFLEFFGMNSMHDLPTLREFTELSTEHRELFKAKTGEIPDLSTEPSPIVESAEETGLEALAEPDEDEDAIDTVGEVAGESGDVQTSEQEVEADEVVASADDQDDDEEEELADADLDADPSEVEPEGEPQAESDREVD